jgi:signal transduction histidine kinase
LQKAIDYLDQAPVGFFSADANGRIQYINATLAGWLGIDLTTFGPGSVAVSDIVAGDGMAMINAVRAEAGMTRTAMFDMELTKVDGVGLPVQTDPPRSCRPRRACRFRRAPSCSTARKPASLPTICAVRRSVSRGFFNSTPMAIAALDKDGRILRTNAPFMTLFGSVADPDALEGHIRFEALLEGDARDRFEKAFAAACASQAKIEPFDTVLKPGPDERHLRVFVNAITGQGGSDAAAEEAAIVYAMDTTEQKALEAQMAQSQKMQAVGQLAGGIAHDFNNVLTAIIMASDLLLANHRPSDPSFPDIMNIKQNANRAASLVRQLLAFSRRQTLRPEVLALTDVLADLRMLLSRLVGNSIHLQIEHGRDLWPVKADLGQFEQVIVNLAVNARDAMPEGGDLTVRTRNIVPEECEGFGYRGFQPGEYVMIEVEDTGTGITAEVLEKIFEPFFTPRKSARAPGLACRWSTASSSRPAVSSMRIRKSARARRSVSSCRATSSRNRKSRWRRSASRSREEARPVRHGDGAAGRRRGCGAHGRRAGADLTRLHGARGIKRRRGAGNHGRARRQGRHRGVGRRDAGDGRTDATDGIAQDASRHQVHLRVGLCRRRIFQEPARGREVRLPAEAVLAQATGDDGQGNAGRRRLTGAGAIEKFSDRSDGAETKDRDAACLLRGEKGAQFGGALLHTFRLGDATGLAKQAGLLADRQSDAFEFRKFDHHGFFLLVRLIPAHRERMTASLA